MIWNLQQNKGLERCFTEVFQDVPRVPGGVRRVCFNLAGIHERGAQDIMLDGQPLPLPLLPFHFGFSAGLGGGEMGFSFGGIGQVG